MALTLATVQAALALDGFDGPAAQNKMKPEPRAGLRPPERPGRARQGAVMVLLYERRGDLHLVLTRRPDTLNSHAGQISFPGGRVEAGESTAEAALRETHEEVGVAPREVTLLGELTPLYIYPSDFEVHPFVGWHAATPRFRPQPEEVAEVIELPLAALFDTTRLGKEWWRRETYELHVPFYRLGEHKIWGATAMMLSEFGERLRLASQPTEN